MGRYNDDLETLKSYKDCDRMVRDMIRKDIIEYSRRKLKAQRGYTKMNTYHWNTEYTHSNNGVTMRDWLDFHNTSLNIYLVDGAYAEGVDTDGNTYGVHASGDGDFTHHKIEFELIAVAE